jgi:hypothetical protein
LGRIVLLAGLAASALVAAWVYRPLVTSGFFLSDDHFLLHEATAGWQLWPSAPWLLTGTRHDEMWRPLGTLSWWLSYQVAGQSARAFYLSSLVLHVANAALVGWLAWRLRFGVLGAIATGGVFALHPIAVESVGWLAARYDLLAIFLALVALHCHLAARTQSLPWRPLAALAFLAALLAKESTVVLPLVALALDLHASLVRCPKRAAATHLGSTAPAVSPLPLGEGQGEGVPGAGAGQGQASLWNQVINALKATWPLWLLAALYLPTRVALLGTLGSYPEYLSFGPYRLLENLLHHLRMILFIPFDRDAFVTPNLYAPPGLTSWRIWAPILAAGALALVLPGARLGLAVALMGLLPVITISGGGRLVYLSIVGYALAAAAVVSALTSVRARRAAQAGANDKDSRPAGAAVSAPRSGSNRPLALARTLLCATAVGALLAAYALTARERAAAWAGAGALVRALPEQARALYPAMPAGARLYVRGLPDHDREVYILRNVPELRFAVDGAAPALSAERGLLARLRPGAAPGDAPDLSAAARRDPSAAALLQVNDFPTSVPPAEACRTLFAQYENGGLTWQPVPIVPDRACAAVDDPLPPGAREVDYRFDDGIRLTGYALGPARVTPGATLRLDLMWRAEAAPSRNYKTFVHVIGPSGPPVAQRDAESYEGRYPTGIWRAGAVVHDRHRIALPPTLPPGQYAIMLGWYAYPDPTRLRVAEGTHPIGDAIRLATVDVVPP